MMATIANCAMVPPKLMPGVSRNGGVNNGRRASNPNSRMPNSHLTGLLNPDHQARSPSPGASSLLAPRW